MARKRQYSDKDKAAALTALDLNGGNVSKTARDTGVPRSTILEWRDGRVNDDVPDIRQHQKGEIVERLDTIIDMLLDAMPGKIPDASLSQVTTAYGTLQDKKLLLTGQPTERTESTVDAMVHYPKPTIEALEEFAARDDDDTV